MALLNATISITAAGDNTVITGVTDKSIRVHRLLIVNNVATAQTVTIKDGASINLTGAYGLPSSIGGGTLIADSGEVIWTLTRDNSFVINLGAATAVAGFVQYTIV